METGGRIAVEAYTTEPLDGAAQEMMKVKAVGDIELEYVTWDLPKAEHDDRSNKAKNVIITPASLFEPGTLFLKPTSGSVSSWSKKQCSRFQTTISLRCVRDIKRDFSWKIYGVCCNPDTGAEAHYVRIKFASKEKDKVFAALSELLDALAAKRFLQSTRRERVHPFGIGFDAGVKSRERCYIISNCAKQTPFLRRVDVQFEVRVGDEWKGFDALVDRIGFATYKSAPKSSILAASTLSAIRFKDDAYLRFARVTLRFGKRAERTVLDVGRDFGPQLVFTKTATILTLNRARVRTCEGRNVSEPIKTQARLVFSDVKTNNARAPFRRNSLGKHCVSEADKVLALLKKTVQLASVNTLSLGDELDDDAVFEMNIQRVITNTDFSIRMKDELSSTKLSLYSLFKNSTLFLVPCYESNGVNLVLQSRNGEFVLRQHVQSPIKFIGSITANSFAGPKLSVISRVGEAAEYDASGKVTYMFETGETDATALVEVIVSIIEKLHSFQITTGIIPKPGSPSNFGNPSDTYPITVTRAISLLPFASLPPIPPIPSIHLSRPPTTIANIPRKPITTTSSTATRPRSASTSPPSVISAPETPSSVDFSTPFPPTVLPPPPPPPPPSHPPPPPPAPIAVPPLTIYKVPRKPVPTQHSRSFSNVNPTYQPTAPPPPPPPLPPPPPPPPQSFTNATTPESEGALELVAPDPSTLPGGRLYELRTRTLKRVITGLDAGLQGTMRTVS